MRIDNVYSENRIHYAWESSLPACPEETTEVIILPDASARKERLPSLCDRSGTNASASVVQLSSGDTQVCYADEPVVEGVFEFDTDQPNEMGYRFSSWVKTVRGVLGQQLKRGSYIDRVV